MSRLARAFVEHGCSTLSPSARHNRPADSLVGAVVPPATCTGSSIYAFNLPGVGINPGNDPTMNLKATWSSSSATSGASLKWDCTVFFTTAVNATYIPSGCTSVATAPTASCS